MPCTSGEISSEPLNRQPQVVWWECMETPSKAPRTEGAAMRRTVAVVIASAVLGGLVGGAVVFLLADGLTGRTGKPSASRQPSAAASKVPSAPSSGPASKQASAGSEWSSPLASAKQMVAAGRLREAQEEYLSILLIEPTHEEAMRGLVRVVGLIAKGDRAALRRQAEEYRQAVALGIETEEHYTAPAMELLRRASLQAAGERVPPAPRTAVPEPAAATSKTSQPQARSRPEQPGGVSSQAQQPARSPATQPQRPPARDVPANPTPTTGPEAPGAATASQVPETTPEARGPLVLLQIGPVSSAVATEILGELTLAGFTARVSSRGGLQVFRVLSEQLRADIASRRAGELTAAGFPARVRPLPGGLAQLDLGVYPTAEGAEAVVGKVRAKGVVVSALPEGGPSRLITVGPHPQATIDEVARALRAKFRGVRFVVARAE